MAAITWFRNWRCLIAAILATTAYAEEAQDRPIVVEADEIPSAYGAPPDLSHGRISTLTKSYVLAPYHFEIEAGYEGAAFRNQSPRHHFRQEIEMGLPGRFTIGLQNEVDHFAGRTYEHSFALEARYALANWNKIPLNPAISAEYRFGLAGMPDSGEVALLISHDFPHEIEWAMNIFIDHALSHRSSGSAGFAQSVEIPVLLPDEKLEAGIEMQYQSGADRTANESTIKGLAVGPTVAWRPTKGARFDLSPLFGCSDHRPVVEVFAVVSFSFGGSDAGEAEKPASGRGR